MAWEEEERSIARGLMLDEPFASAAIGLSDGEVGKSNVSARPESVAKLMNGIVNRSMPMDIWRRMWWGEDGSSRDRRGRRVMAVVAGMSRRRVEE